MTLGRGGSRRGGRDPAYRKLEPLKGQCLQAGRPHFCTQRKASAVGLAWGGVLLIESQEAALCGQIMHECWGVISLTVKHGAIHQARLGALKGVFGGSLTCSLGELPKTFCLEGGLEI